MPTISPDGRRIAMLTDAGGSQAIVVISRDGADPAGANVSEVRPERLFWATNDIVIIVASIPETSSYGVEDHRAMFALDLNRGGRLRELFSRGSRDPDMAYSINRANVIGRVPETGELIVPLFSRPSSRALYSVDPENGLYSRVDRTSEPVIDYVVDDQGRPLARASYHVRTERYVLELKGEEFWSEVVERQEPLLTQSMWGLLTGSRDELVMSERPDTGGRRLITVSSADGSYVRTLYQNADFDFNHVIRDNYDNSVVGVDVDEDMPSTVWFDAELAAIQETLDGAIPDAFVSLLSWSEDRSQVTLAAYRANTPPEYFLFDGHAMQLASLGNAYPELAGVTLPDRQAIRYRASDGTSIPGYLTIPAGSGPFPLVVLPHGGPASRDVGGFDDLAHFLASRGYLVLQPNFRGSGGYGHAWESAGWGGWGTGVMQQDVTDGVNALVRAGQADGDRVCIVGASYGGYAALAGATFTPDVYQCAVAISPVTDLVATTREVSNPREIETPFTRRFALQLTGTTTLPDDDAARAISPRFHAGNITIPVLLIHGRDDSVVDEEQSRDMDRALRNAGRDVSFLRPRDVDHWLSSVEARRIVFSATEDFLADHISD